MVTEKVTVRLLKEHPEEAFHFSLKTFVDVFVNLDESRQINRNWVKLQLRSYPFQRQASRSFVNEGAKISYTKNIPEK